MMTKQDIREERKARKAIAKAAQDRLNEILSAPRGRNRSHPPFRAAEQGAGTVAYISKEAPTLTSTLPVLGGSSVVEPTARNYRDRARRDHTRDFSGPQRLKRAGAVIINAAF